MYRLLNWIGRLVGFEKPKNDAVVESEEKSFQPPVPEVSAPEPLSVSAEIIPLKPKRVRPSRAKSPETKALERGIAVVKELSPEARKLVLNIRFLGKTVYEIEDGKLVSSPLSIRREVISDWRDALAALEQAEALTADISDDRVVVSPTDLTYRLKEAWEALPEEPKPEKAESPPAKPRGRR